MFVKWPKIYRILVPQVNIQGKQFLSDEDTKRLLEGTVTISEKTDGDNVGIIRTKDDFKLQKRDSLIDQLDPEQFNSFKAWSKINYDKLLQIPKDTILYGEWMDMKHNIHYDMLPDYFLAFGWWDRKTKKFAHHIDMEELCEKIGISTVPMVEQTTNVHKNDLFDTIPDPSFCGHEPAEGIIVYNYKQQLRGKIVREQFQKSMDMNVHVATKKITKNIVSDICTCEVDKDG